jgi:hypothetical protein
MQAATRTAGYLLYIGDGMGAIFIPRPGLQVIESGLFVTLTVLG